MKHNTIQTKENFKYFLHQTTRTRWLLRALDKCVLPSNSKNLRLKLLIDSLNGFFLIFRKCWSSTRATGSRRARPCYTRTSASTVWPGTTRPGTTWRPYRPTCLIKLSISFRRRTETELRLIRRQSTVPTVVRL